jgi:hypothetical protein
MKILGLTLAFFILLTSCMEKKKETFDLNLLQNEWVRLTEKDGKLVVYNSCDAGNLLLTITKTKDYFDLLLHGQQEDYDFEILETSQINDTIFLNVKWKESDEKQDFKFFWTDKEKGLARFITTYSNGFTSDNLFVTKDKQTNFEKVDQPCKECWGDECDETETVTVNLEKPIEKIRIVFEDYIKYEESTDSPEDKELMTKSLQSLNIIKNPEELELLVNVWMYYDPTDFPSRNLVYNVLKENVQLSIQAVNNRIRNKKEWESKESAPYSDLEYLLEKLENE